jgi:intein/homing endonuclease
MHTYEIRTDEAVTASTRGRIITDTEAKEIHDWTLPNVKGEALTVAVMDTGIDENLVDSHPWFEGATLTKQYDATGHGTGEDEVGHGTGCASIIANATPKVELYDVRIFGDQGASNGVHSIRRAYKWMINHSNEIDVVNMSWGMRQDIPQVNSLHDKLMENDIYDVVAAGNTGTDGGSPATAPKAFSAGAIDEGGDPTRFSSFDPDQGNPDVAAVGQNVKMARACMPYHTKILTNEGWKQLGNIHRMKEKPKAITYNIDNSQFEKQNITDSLKRKVEESEKVYKIYTDEGHIIKATGNHPVLTSEGYVEAENISINDEIITKPDTSKENKSSIHENCAEIVECSHCKSTFPKTSSQKKYCSEECSYEAKKKRVRIKCKQCNSEIEKTPSDDQKFCNKVCYEKYVKENGVLFEKQFGEDHPRYKGKDNHKCKKCGEKFEAYESESKKYCSKKCYWNDRSENPSKFNQNRISEWAERNSKEHKKAGRKGAKVTFDKLASGEEKTSIEEAVEKVLQNIGTDFVYEHPITENGNELVTSIDFAIPERKIAIYCDGDYWHSSEKVKKRDKKINRKLEDMGWKVVRYTGTEIRENDISNQIAKEVTNGAKVKYIEEVECKSVYDITTEKNHNYVANGLVVHNSGTSMGTPLNSDFVKSSGTSFAAPYVAAAYVNALYKKRRDWDRQFMNSSKDVPGTKKDGAGILKLQETISS